MLTRLPGGRFAARLDRQAACTGCGLRAACGGTGALLLDADNCLDLAEGSTVRASLSVRAALIALLLAFGMPLLAAGGAVAIALARGAGDALAAACGFGAVVVSYLLLHLTRGAWESSVRPSVHPVSDRVGGLQ